MKLRSNMKIDYKISNDYPPKRIYKKALRLFGRDTINFKKGTTFTVGNTIYCAIPVPKDLLTHELTHIKQQAAMGWRKWWRKYFKDAEFRYSQEIEAYRNQYNWVKNNIKDRNTQNKYLIFYARSLSGKLYNNLKTFDEALREISNK